VCSIRKYMDTNIRSSRDTKYPDHILNEQLSFNSNIIYNTAIHILDTNKQKQGPDDQVRGGGASDMTYQPPIIDLLSTNCFTW
jgi:hypothetical protein